MRPLEGSLRKKSLKATEVKVPPISLGDNLSETAGQQTLRDAPVVIKLRRQFTAFLVTFLAEEKSDWLSGHPRRS